ncbi:MAG: VTT domain-containing protein [Clostridia bacterium]|nr:VTT domain-containing protein [Clostridia bacterium]
MTKNEKLVKGLQLASGIFMAVMLVVMVILMIKYNITPANADVLSTYFQGGAVTIAVLMIVISVVKSFALVFPPALLFAISGIVFENFWVAVAVNFVGNALSMLLTYFLGRFTGKSMVDTLKQKFPKVKKIDDFTEANQSAVVFCIKASGLLPSDLSSVLFGAMNISFPKYLIAANLGMLPIDILWTLLGYKGDVSNPFSLLYILPIPVFAVFATVLMKKMSNKKNKPEQAENGPQE